MDWRERITSHTDTLFGRPHIEGTRIGVDFILDIMSSGWSEVNIPDNYPHLKQENLQAAFASVRAGRAYAVHGKTNPELRLD